ncbi:MAG: two-component sensor histidine kinase, partial [Lachnospiraceae bacterium]|nr:two-component sensor histidine kinase [Lachnospiraceae bacterium]
MKNTLYLKFLLAYLIFGFFGFVVVATFASSMTEDMLRRNKAESLYKVATLVADTYATDLYTSSTSLDTVKNEIDMLDLYLTSTIRIISPSGAIILDSSTPYDVENPVIVENFDPVGDSDTFYTIGTFFDTFDEEVLSVSAPIIVNYKVQGYVVIHTTIQELDRFTNQILNISYITLIILFLLSL